MDIDILLLIADFENYNLICANIKKKNNELMETWRELGGVKGVDFEKVRGSYNPAGEEARKEPLRKRVDFLEKKIKNLVERKKRVEEVMEAIFEPLDRDFIKDVLIDGMTYDKACMVYGIASKSKIKKEVYRILQEATEGE